MRLVPPPFVDVPQVVGGPHADVQGGHQLAQVAGVHEAEAAERQVRVQGVRVRVHPLGEAPDDGVLRGHHVLVVLLLADEFAHLEHAERSPDPERVARVHGLVRPALEAVHLAEHQPPGDAADLCIR